MAFLKGSRYEGTQLFGDGASFKGVRPRPIGPASPVLEHSVSLKERLDQLGQEYYRAPRSWTRLAEANLHSLFAEDLLFDPEGADENGRERLGEVLLVPRREEES